MIIVSLGPNRSICRVRRVVVLPVNVHETCGDVSYMTRCSHWESYVVTNEDRSDLNGDDVNTEPSSHSKAMSRMIGIASSIAAAT